LVRTRKWSLIGAVTCSITVLAHSSYAQAQDTPNKSREQLPAALTQRDANTVAFAVPGFRPGRNSDGSSTLLLHGVSFEGAGVPASRLHIKELSDGVFELTGEAPTVGIWKFALNDAADGYFALGERFDSLNHSHQI
jgi:hypothetical protein